MKKSNFSEIINLSKKFVAPVMGNAQDGCGVFVGNRFITAGHVAKNSDLPYFTYHEGKKIVLDKTNLLAHCYFEQLTGEPECGDYAVFSVDDVNSPLNIADYHPEEGQELLCVYYDTEVSKQPKEGVPDIFTTSEEIVQKTTIVNVRKESQGNFFAVDSADFLRVGNSGAPLIDADGNVVGILRGGQLGTSCCVFQYANTIPFQE